MGFLEGLEDREQLLTKGARIFFSNPDNQGMKNKKYLLVTLLAGAALLSGCSPASSGSLGSGQDPEISNAAVSENGMENPSDSFENIEEVPKATFEEGATELVVIPEVIATKPDYIPLNIGEISGSVVETEEEVTVVFNKYDGMTIRQWVADLKNTGWAESQPEVVDNETTYNTYLSKGEESILVYSNNLPENQNTVISFSK